MKVFLTPGQVPHNDSSFGTSLLFGFKYHCTVCCLLMERKLFVYLKILKVKLLLYYFMKVF